jgi:hypothetical protein
VFLGGVVNGLLPCGLVYAYLALAAGAGGSLRGALAMALFGLGTMPLLALVGCGGHGGASQCHVMAPQSQIRGRRPDGTGSSLSTWGR